MTTSAADTAVPARYVPELVTAPSAQIDILSPFPIDIVDDGRGIGAALAVELAERGYDATVVDEVDADRPMRQLIDLRGLALVDSIDGAVAIQRRAFQTARDAAGDARTFVVAFDTGGTLGFDPSSDYFPDGVRPWLGGLAALAKTADLEWNDANVKAIDIATDGLDADTIAGRLADELTDGGPEVEIAIDPVGRRRTVRTRQCRAESSDGAPVGPGDVVVASGGARGVTARCLIELAETWGPAIVLLGRTPLTEEPKHTADATTDAELKRALIDAARNRGETPNPKEIGNQTRAILKQREIRATIDAIETAGAPVRYVSADVRDRDALRRALDDVRADFGPPTALVHAAGVLADKQICDKTDDQFDFVFNTKVDGLRALLEVTDGDPIDHLWLFSSVAARTGNIGQVDYAMANETLNKVAAAHSRAGDVDGRSLNWGPWDGGMVDDTLRAHFASQGVSLIDLDGGARAFVRELSHRDHPVEVVVGDGLAEAAEKHRVNLSFDHVSHPELAGHAIDGTVVVPAAVVVDLFAGFAASCRPHSDLQRLRDIEILRGIQLPDFGDSSPATRFCAFAEHSDGDRAALNLELRAADGTPHYRAVAQFGDGTPTPNPLDLPRRFADNAADAEKLYADALFHSGDFRVIESVEGIGDSTARAKIRPTTRAIAIDAGLQLAVAQGVATGGRANLPTGLESYTDFGIGAAPAELEIVARRRKNSAHGAVFDLDFRDGAGQLVAAIRGLQMHFHGEPISSFT